MSVAVAETGIDEPLAAASVSDAETTARELPPDDAPPPAAPLLGTALAAGLAMAAAGFMLGGVFRGVVPRAVGIAAPVAGVGLTALCVRTRRTWPQYLVVPIAVVLGALATMGEATGRGTAALPSLVVEAVRGGGLSQPPVPFDPGWRFLLTAVLVLLGAASSALAFGLRRPRLGVACAVPFAVAGELVQPAGAALGATMVAGVLIISAVGVSFGAAMASEGVEISAGYERGRLLRTGALLLAVIVATAGISRAQFLFPQPRRASVIPPQRPQVPPAEADIPLFSYRTTQPAALRTGVLDVYSVRDHAWMLPPYDTGRLRRLDHGALPSQAASAAGTFTVTVTVSNLTGHVLPDVAEALSLTERGSDALAFDPRTDTVQLADRRVHAGLTYTVRAPLPPSSGTRLAQAPPPPESLRDYLVAPPIPAAVTSLLTGTRSDPYDRMLTLRDYLLNHVVAAGAGRPVDVSADRVVTMLRGGEANPYEIVAGEALLARWAGVPARVGFGYYGGEQQKDGSYVVRPRNGSAWLETYFSGYGWVPIIGLPAQAKSSTDDQEKNPYAAIRPSDKIGLTVYVPTKDVTPQVYFEVVRWWLLEVGPWILLAVLLLVLHPALVKAVRSLARRSWGARRGARERVLVAYGGFRDMLNDLNVGDARDTPLEFLRAVDPDAEHAELAWLATRALWGDLQRDLRDYDAERAAELASSVTRRVVVMQNGLNVALAMVSRTSLRDPWSREMPALWPHSRGPEPTGSGTRPSRPWRLRRTARALAALVGAVLVAGCGASAGYDNFRGPTRLAGAVDPVDLGELHFVPAPAAVTAAYRSTPQSLAQAGRVWLIHRADSVEGSVQVSLIERTVRADDPLVLDGLDAGIGGAAVKRVHIVPDQVVWEKDLANQHIYIWFPPRANAIELLVLRNQFRADRPLVAALVDVQHGRRPGALSLPPDLVPNVSIVPAAADFGRLGGGEAEGTP